MLGFAVGIGEVSVLGDLPALSASEVGSFPLEDLLLPKGFALRTEALFASNGLLRLRLAFDRCLDLVLLAFMAKFSDMGLW